MPAPIRPEVLAGVLVALFTASLTSFVIGIALPTVAGDLGVAGAAATFTRMLGGAFGVAAFGGMIAARLRADLPAALSAAGRPADGAALHRLLGTPAEIAALPAPLTEAVRFTARACRPCSSRACRSPHSRCWPRS